MVDLEQRLHSAASVQGVHGLLKPVCLNTYGKYCTYVNFLLVAATEYCVI